MSTPNNGGPAFPRSGFEVDREERGNFDTSPQTGMSLRDWFAGRAITGLVQFADAPTRLRPEEMAEAAYRIADALLAQSVKGGAA
ncbi:hypothetical protein R5W23_000861 [Gemmata sp. JC673]|uniref:Uncharacterized protein n=1 Tax=Gemmata algarum TaxID=2975278 RepID=A0ABU5ESL3_9BACT|nr:hypothetical protein [Gemmata algarum]MDY3558140.1 hypothetical protein [Gemmata algarum]